MSYAVAGLVRVAHRAGEPDPAAESRDRDRRIRRIAAADLLDMVRADLGAALRQIVDAEGQVPHRHPHAQDARRRRSLVGWRRHHAV